MGADRTKLKDLDFADGTVLIDENRDSMQELAAKVESEADKIGLRVNGDKCKVMISSMCERESLGHQDCIGINYQSCRGLLLPSWLYQLHRKVPEYKTQRLYAVMHMYDIVICICSKSPFRD